MKKLRSVINRSACLTVIGLFAGGLALTGCNPALEDSQLFKDFTHQQKVTEQLGEDTKVISRQVKDVSQSIARLTSEVDKLRAAVEEGAAGGGGALAKRVGLLENSLNVTNRSLAALGKQLKENEEKANKIATARRPAPKKESEKTLAAATPNSEETAKTDPEKPATAGTKRTTLVKLEPIANRVKIDPPPAPEPARGKYYRVRLGDTAEEIAARHGISAGKLRNANRIPEGTQPLAGVRIFVPPAE